MEKMVYEEIAEIIHDRLSSLPEKYNWLYVLFVRLLEEQTEHSGYSFSGPFPRMTRVCKDHGFSDAELYRLNRFRVHCLDVLRRHEAPDYLTFRYDVKALVHSISRWSAEEVPGALEDWFPTDDGSVDWQPPKTRENLRMVVDTWDDSFIYGYAEDEQLSRVQVDYHAQAENDDMAYLSQLLSPGSQLYLLDLKTDEGGILQPKLIIYEPDYLVDISSIAACWKEYGHQPYNHLLRKLAPAANTPAIQLGNLAGQFLDEVINNRGGKPVDYVDSIKRFFHHAALDLITCGELGEFHREARAQLNNITHFVEDVFAGMYHMDLEELILEPSFLCEELGLQGRVDFLQNDYRVLLEQKSGKRAYASNGHKEEHYIQILLYRILLLYNFGIKGKDSRQYLFYSRYPDGLLPEDAFNPHLMREALKLRNQIVKCDLLYAEGKIGPILEQLTPSHLNTYQRHDVLWNHYQEPQLNQLLQVFKRASKLEKAYFSRLFTFVAKEHVFAKTGNSCRTHGFSGVWRCELLEKRLLGNILTDLELSDKQESVAGGGYDRVTLSIPPQGEDFLPNFRVGDIVILYAYALGTEPHANKAKILRGSILAILPEAVSVQLRFPQRNTCIFPEDSVWAIEHDFMESSYTAIYRGLYAFLSAREERRNLLLNVRKPRRNPLRKLNGDYDGGAVPLNPFLLKAKQAEDYFLLVGPPGTGKTSYALVALVREALSEEGISVLLMAYTNRAVDEICEKMQRHEIPFLRIGSHLSCDPRFHGQLLGSRVQTCNNIQEIRQLIMQTRVFVGTTTAVSSRLNLFSLKHFELAIIDEASQILEPHLLGILSAQHGGRNAIGKFILIGDHKQLPAVVQQPEESSKVSEPMLREIGLLDCRQSLFERLIRLQRQNGTEDFIYQLSRQGRMHPEVALFANEAFYGSTLQPIPVFHQCESLPPLEVGSADGLEQLVSSRRMAFIVSRGDRRITLSEKVNLDEARRVAVLLRAIYLAAEHREAGSFHPYHTVGVIVPYRNQIAMIRKELSRLDIPALMDVSIDTVERYQGSERDCIVYSFTIQRPYQLEFLTGNTFEEDGQLIDRKLNVALTRARKQMFLVGNPDLLGQNALFRSLMDKVKAGGGWIDVSTDRFVTGGF